MARKRKSGDQRVLRKGVQKGANQLRQGAREIRRELRDGVGEIADSIGTVVEGVSRLRTPFSGPKLIDLLNSARFGLVASLRQMPRPPVPGPEHLGRIRSDAIRFAGVCDLLRSAMKELHSGPNKHEINGIMTDVLLGKAAWSEPWEFANETLGFDLTEEAGLAAGVPRWMGYSLVMGYGGDAGALGGIGGGIFFASGLSLKRVVQQVEGDKQVSSAVRYSVGVSGGASLGINVGASIEGQAGFYLIQPRQLHGISVALEGGGAATGAFDVSLQYDFFSYSLLLATALHHSFSRPPSIGRLLPKVGVVVGIGGGSQVQADCALYATAIAVPGGAGGLVTIRLPVLGDYPPISIPGH